MKMDILFVHTATIKTLLTDQYSYDKNFDYINKTGQIRPVYVIYRYNHIISSTKPLLRADLIQADFQAFYHETLLQEEVNTDLLYKVQRELRGYRIYDDTDIKKFCDVYFAKGAQGENAQGILASKLFPAIDR